MKSSRNTQTTQVILKLLEESELALSHHEIHSLIGLKCDRVTVYRILNKLVEKKLAHRITGIDRTIKYSSCRKCSAVHQHLHFRCEHCHSIIHLEQKEPSFRLPKNYTIKEINFTITGICKNCSD